MVQRSASPRRTAVAAAVAVLVLAGVALLGVALLPRGARPPDDTQAPGGPGPTVPAPAATGGGVPGVADRLHGPSMPPSPPTAMRVRRLALDQPLVRLEVDRSGALEPPGRPQDVGWFAGSVTPGEVGPAVLAGHVTWNGAPAVFYRLGALRPGDRVAVSRADGSTAVFAVARVERHAKSRFPTTRVYGATDHASLRLITCGGRYDAVRHRYADNVVVFADLVDSR